MLHHLTGAIPEGRAPRAAAGSQFTDDILVERIAAGDKLAMQALFARHRLRVFRFVRGLTGDAALADDVVADTFLDVWRHAGRYERRCAVSTWLLTIARNKAVSALRRRPHATLDEALGIEDPAETPDVAAERIDRAALLRKCLAALSHEHREIIDLVYYHEQPIADVAQIVGVPLGTVKTRMFYARKRLAELLAAAGVDRA